VLHLKANDEKTFIIWKSFFARIAGTAMACALLAFKTVSGIG